MKKNDNDFYKYVEFFQNTFYINNDEEEYVLELTYNNKSNDYKNNIYNLYLRNYKLLKTYNPNLKKVRSFDELVKLINNKKNNIYILFENNLNTNIKYYLILWNEFHS